MPNMHTFSDRILTKGSFIAAIAAAVVAGASVDTAGYPRAVAEFYSAPSGAGTTSDCKLQESADNAAWADVPGAAFAQATTAGGAKIALLNVDLTNRLRYLRLVHTGAGGAAAGAASGTIKLYNGSGMPPAQDVAPISV